MDKRTGWLAELRQGDEVGIIKHCGEHYEAAIATVQRIDSRGWIRATGTMGAFDPEGRGRMEESSHYLAAAAVARGMMAGG